MNKRNVSFADWTVNEISNASNIDLHTVKSEKTTAAIKTKILAMQYCQGPTDVQVIVENENVFEGRCIMSFFCQTSDVFVNTQFFKLNDFSDNKLKKTFLIIRRSFWERQKDMVQIWKKESLSFPTCFGNSVVIADSNASVLIDKCTHLGDLFYGQMTPKFGPDAAGSCTLKVEDSYGVCHKIQFNNNIHISPIETEIKSIIDEATTIFNSSPNETGVSLRFIF